MNHLDTAAQHLEIVWPALLVIAAEAIIVLVLVVAALGLAQLVEHRHVLPLAT